MLYNVAKVLLPLLIACLIPFGLFFEKHQLLAQDYLGIIDETNTKLKEEKDTYQAIIANIVNRAAESTSTLDSQGIEQIFNKTPLYQGQLHTSKQIGNSASCSGKEREGFWIFVSFSMPNNLIANYAKFAQKIGANLVIRGLKNNSFKETIEYIKQIEKQGLKIAIYPQIFKEFQINHVPSFVLSNGKLYDKITGSIGINYVLTQFSYYGELKSQAQKYLHILGGIDD